MHKDKIIASYFCQLYRYNYILVVTIYTHKFEDCYSPVKFIRIAYQYLTTGCSRKASKIKYYANTRVNIMRMKAKTNLKLH